MQLPRQHWRISSSARTPSETLSGESARDNETEERLVWNLPSGLATNSYRKLKIAPWFEFQWSTNLSSSFLHCPAHDLSVLQRYVY